MNLVKTALLILFLTTGTSLLAQHYGTLEITFNGIRSSKGDMALGVFKPSDRWPDKPFIEPAWDKKLMRNGTLVVRIDSLSYGTYAAIVLDDEDNNREMKMFMGMPREGFSFSNNPKMKMTAPKYEDCTFGLNSPVHRIVMEVRYVGKR